MIVELYEVEWYPVITLFKTTRTDSPWGFEVPDELVARYEKLYEEFSKIQDELRKIYDKDEGN